MSVLRTCVSLVLLGGLVGLGACQAQPGAASAPAGAAAQADAEASLLARIRAEVGEARCSSDAQCRTLPVGEKACGGPEARLPYSTGTARVDQLKAWTTELNKLARQRVERSGMMSNCLYVADPGAVCVAQRCVLATPKLAR